ncbi:MAG: hypothetical protein CEE38_21990 [Planctomycetes bacterium B3_Pla]|nr:MAG: hypothetical protein CEE38_21990 [Planctomycetes bacterium B3_Pla]
MKKVKQKMIPNSLRKCRRARGLTQKEVAHILGLNTTGLISRWENGVCFPNPLTIIKLAILYRTMADGLFIDLRRSLKDEIHKAEKKLLRKKANYQND